jgi:predicted ester cyclase
VEPFVALMRRYCIDYTNSHDLGVCDEIMEPSYVVHISGWDLPRDAAYKPAVRRTFERFPGLQLQVHEFVTNGERLAMRFSEHGAASDASGRCAAWGGIGLYRWNGRKLLENFVEQDFFSQEEQLASGVPAPIESPHHDPWVATRAAPADPSAERIARAWLAGGDLRAADSATIDDSWHAGAWQPPLDIDSVEIGDVFSAGDRVAFHIRQRGRYRGSLSGVSAASVGREATLICAGLARVHEGAVREVRVITDRAGVRRALARDPS